MKRYRLDGWQSAEVKGVSHRKYEIRQVLGSRTSQAQAYEAFTCQLVPEPDNPHDANAVSVRVRNVTIGYLAKELAGTWAPVIHRLIASNYIPEAQCDINWVGGHDGDLDDDYVRADVRLPEPHKAIPLNAPPPQSALFPPGGSAQVTKEEDHFDVLFEYVPPEGEGLLYLELKLGSRVLKNGQTRTIVYVYLDGEEIGELSPVTGKKFEPALRHLEDIGRRGIVLGEIKGSALSASLTFKAAKSDELDDTWVNKPKPAPGPMVPIAPSYPVPPAYRPSWAEMNPRQAAAKNTPAGKQSGGCALVLVAGLGIASAIGTAIGTIA